MKWKSVRGPINLDRRGCVDGAFRAIGPDCPATIDTMGVDDLIGINIYLSVSLIHGLFYFGAKVE